MAQFGGVVMNEQEREKELWKRVEKAIRDYIVHLLVYSREDKDEKRREIKRKLGQLIDTECFADLTKHTIKAIKMKGNEPQLLTIDFVCSNNKPIVFLTLPEEDWETMKRFRYSIINPKGTEGIREHIHIENVLVVLFKPE